MPFLFADVTYKQLSANAIRKLMSDNRAECNKCRQKRDEKRGGKTIDTVIVSGNEEVSLHPIIAYVIII